MRIGILCAGDDEVAPFLKIIKDVSVMEKSMLKFYCGKIENTDVVTLYSGVGKVNAAIAAQNLIDAFHCNIILNVGTAGGISDSVSLFDTVISTKVAYHDMDEDILTDFHPWLLSVWLHSDDALLSGLKETAKKFPSKVAFGAIVSGDTFIEDNDRERIKQEFMPLCADMESAAVAHVCYVNKIPFIAVRTITDTAEHGGKQNFELNVKKASDIAANFAVSSLKDIETFYKNSAT